MYIDTSAPAKPGDRALLKSERLSDSGKSCFQFWYNMYGTTVDRLNVRLRFYQGGDVQVDPAAQEFLVWSLKGDQGQGWKYAQVSEIEI